MAPHCALSYQTAICEFTARASQIIPINYLSSTHKSKSWDNISSSPPRFPFSDCTEGGGERKALHDCVGNDEISIFFHPLLSVASFLPWFAFNFFFYVDYSYTFAPGEKWKAFLSSAKRVRVIDCFTSFSRHPETFILDFFSVLMRFPLHTEIEDAE